MKWNYPVERAVESPWHWTEDCLVSNLGAERSRHNESHYELVISHPSPPQTTLDLEKQRALCVLGPVPALCQRKKVYLVCAPTRYWHILLPLGWVLSSSVRAGPDRCCHGGPLARQMQPLCRSWLLPSSACQCPEMVCLYSYLWTGGSLWSITLLRDPCYLQSLGRFWTRCVVLFVQMSVISELDFLLVQQQMSVKSLLEVPETRPCHRIRTLIAVNPK